jgi:hypothetical protein
MSESVWLNNKDEAEQRRLMATVTDEQREKILKHLTWGANVQGATSVGDALAKAGADFTVDKYPTMAVIPSAEEGGEPSAIEIAGEAAVVATWPNGKQAAFGSVGATYRCIQSRAQPRRSARPLPGIDRRVNAGTPCRSDYAGAPRKVRDRARRHAEHDGRALHRQPLLPERHDRAGDGSSPDRAPHRSR